MKQNQLRHLAALCFAVTSLLIFPDVASPHGDEDHSGESLASGGGPGLGVPIHVPKPTQFLLGIETARAAEKTVPRQLGALGRVAIPTPNRAEVYSPFQGLLVTGKDVSVPEQGQRVQAGEILAMAEQVINAPETVALITEIAKMQSDLKQAREEFSLARMELTRVESLGEAVSGRRVAEAKAASAIGRERVAGLSEALAEMRRAVSIDNDNPRVVSLRAPIDGVISASHVTPGEYIETQKLLFEIIDSSRVWVEADIYEMDLAIVEDANVARVITEAYPSERFTGHLNYVGQRLDLNTRTVKAVFDVDNPEGRLRDGMFVSVSIETKSQETGPMFPKSAVVNENGQNVVYVKASPETFIARAVEITGTWGDEVMVTSGVAPDEIVVVQGMYQVRTSAL